MSDVASPPDARKAGRYVYGTGVFLLCAWVLVPLYFLLINTLSSPEAVTAFPKAFVPEFDLGSLAFFSQFAGMLSALKNSIIVAVLTMIMSILVGAPAGYALSRFEFRGKELFSTVDPVDPRLSATALGVAPCSHVYPHRFG